MIGQYKLDLCMVNSIRDTGTYAAWTNRQTTSNGTNIYTWHDRMVILYYTILESLMYLVVTIEVSVDDFAERISFVEH